jgi:hypothetical protein
MSIRFQKHSTGRHHSINSIMKHTFFLETYQLKDRKSREGYVALLSVIALGAVGLAITVSLLTSGITFSKTNFEVQQKIQSRMAATSCAEEAMQQILDTGIETGSGILTIGSSTCSYTISSTSTNLLVQAVGTSTSVVTRLNIILASSTPRIKLSSWQEVGDF